MAAMHESELVLQCQFCRNIIRQDAPQNKIVLLSVMLVAWHKCVCLSELSFMLVAWHKCVCLSELSICLFYSTPRQFLRLYGVGDERMNEWIWRIRGMLLTKQTSRFAPRKTCPSATLSITTCTWTGLCDWTAASTVRWTDLDYFNSR
jgi:hypothetical protein